MWEDGKARSTDQFDHELMEGEKILWQGQPDANKLFNASDIFYVPFSLLWGGFALFWNITVWASNAPFFFRLWGLPFLVVGLYMIVGRFIYKGWRKRHTYYAVTNKRLLVLTTGFRHSLESFRVSSLPELSKSVDQNGVGSITFGKAPEPRMGRRSRTNMSNTGMEAFGYTVPGFYDIPQVNDVYALINELSFKGENA